MASSSLHAHRDAEKVRAKENVAHSLFRAQFNEAANAIAQEESRWSTIARSIWSVNLCGSGILRGKTYESIDGSIQKEKRKKKAGGKY